MTDTPPTEQQLDEIETRAAHLHEYATQDDGEGDTLAGEDVPALVAEIRRQRAELAAVPDRLETVLTERFTELGNPYSRMSINFQGPDGWPASKEVGPHDVAEVLRELLATRTADPAPAEDFAGTQPCGHDDYHPAHPWHDRPNTWCPGHSHDDQAATEESTR